MSDERLRLRANGRVKLTGVAPLFYDPFIAGLNHFYWLTNVGGLSGGQKEGIGASLMRMKDYPPIFLVFSSPINPMMDGNQPISALSIITYL